MNFELIVALNNDGIIGINNRIPWHIPEDLIRFKKMTENNIVVMGRKTFDSLPSANRPLKNRINIVLTSTPEKYEDNEDKTLFFSNEENVFRIIQEALVAAKEKKVFIIGGSDIYKLFIDYCSILHITCIYLNKEFYFKKDKNVDDTIAFFPYSFKELIGKGFILQEKKEKKDTKEKTVLHTSKNETVKFKYSTYIRNLE